MTIAIHQFLMDLHSEKYKKKSKNIMPNSGVADSTLK